MNFWMQRKLNVYFNMREGKDIQQFREFAKRSTRVQRQLPQQWSFGTKTAKLNGLVNIVDDPVVYKLAIK